MGSEEKVKFLVHELGVTRNRIFYSRDPNFYDDLRVATHGDGIDYMLNSVSVELQHTSWECVASD